MTEERNIKSLDFHLKVYLEKCDKGRPLGPTHFQRTCRVGYKLACLAIQRGFERGVLTHVIDDDSGLIHKVGEDIQ